MSYDTIIIIITSGIAGYYYIMYQRMCQINLDCANFIKKLMDSRTMEEVRHGSKVPF